jgi:hypothetical protein
VVETVGVEEAVEVVELEKMVEAVEPEEPVDDGSAGDVDVVFEDWPKSGRGTARLRRLKKKSGKRFFLFMGVSLLSMGGAL